MFLVPCAVGRFLNQWLIPYCLCLFKVNFLILLDLSLFLGVHLLKRLRLFNFLLRCFKRRILHLFRLFFNRDERVALQNFLINVFLCLKQFHICAYIGLNGVPPFRFLHYVFVDSLHLLPGHIDEILRNFTFFTVFFKFINLALHSLIEEQIWHLLRVLTGLKWIDKWHRFLLKFFCLLLVVFLC